MVSEKENTVVLSEIDDGELCGSKRMFLQTTLKGDGKQGFDLILLDGSTVWEGTITESYLDDQCDQLRMDFSTYVKESASALTGDAKTDKAFECHFQTVAANTGRLVWKKIPAKSIKFNLGSVDLKKSSRPGDKVISVLSQCIGRTHTLQSNITSLETDNERLSQDRQNALKRLEKCVSAKDQLEKDLYSKFVLVLNSKKERIRQLEEQQVSQSVDGASVVEPSSPPCTSTGVTRDAATNNQSHTIANMNQNSASHNDDSANAAFDVDTDEEVAPPPPKKSRSNKTSPGVASDSSINFGDDDGDNVGKKTPVARRARRQPAAKKETPAKPVLPRVSSAASDKSDQLGQRRSSLRKSGSGRSNKSSDNLDPDDLMDDLF